MLQDKKLHFVGKTAALVDGGHYRFFPGLTIISLNFMGHLLAITLYHKGKQKC